MNHIDRLVWNDLNNAWVAGAEKCGQSQRNSRYSNCLRVSEEKS